MKGSMVRVCRVLSAVFAGLLISQTLQAAEVPIKVLRTRSVSTTTTSRELVYASVPATASDAAIVASVKDYALKQRKAAGIDEVTVLVDLDLAKDCEKIVEPYLTVNDAGKVKQGYSDRNAYMQAIGKLRSQKSCKALY
jgi:hypothetical protein